MWILSYELNKAVTNIPIDNFKHNVCQMGLVPDLGQMKSPVIAVTVLNNICMYLEACVMRG